MKTIRIVLMALLVAGLAACDDGGSIAGRPAPQEPGPDAIGHYCGMAIVEHSGPKGQAFLKDRANPLWFSSVRDTLAFTMLPEEPKGVAAIYVNDMGRSENGREPVPGAWVPVSDAFFVAGSAAVGGMGAMEVVPFAERSAAERFRGAHGGEIFRFGEVPERFVLGSTEAPASPIAGSGDGPAGGSHAKH